MIVTNLSIVRFFLILSYLFSRAFSPCRFVLSVLCVLLVFVLHLNSALAQDQTASNASLESAPVADIACWWVSEGEVASLAVIQRHVEAQGLRWHQRVAPGSGTSLYWDELKKWRASGHSPMAAHVIGFDIQDWASQGKLVILDDIAKEGNWDEVVPHGIQRLSKYQGHWVAVPINAHSTNWLWTNHAVLHDLGLSAPDTWDDLLAALKRAQEAGIIPLAIGGGAWEHTLLFECVAAGSGGAELYRRAFLDLDPTALEGPEIEEIFHRMSVLRTYVDPGFRERTWDEATSLLRAGKALFQVQGSWVLGEFRFHGVKVSQDCSCQNVQDLDVTQNFGCLRFPDTQGMFLLNADQYMLFNDAQASPEVQAAFVRALISTDLHAELSVATGAAPARVDIPRHVFDPCGQRSITDMRNANLRRTLMGSIAMANANPAPVKEAIYEVVTNHFLGKLTDQEAADQLRSVIAHYAPLFSSSSSISEN